MRLSLFGFLALLCLSCHSGAAELRQVTFDQVLALPASAPDAVLPYGTAPAQFGELWLPANVAAPGSPLLVLIHGGCWLSTYDVVHSRAMAMNLREAGYAVWSLEYRRVGDPGGGWPGTFDDIATGVDYIRQLQAYPIDLQRVLLVGHSAGGQLALWAAAQAGQPEAGATKPQILGVVGLAAIVDLAAYAGGSSGCERAALALMGAPPEEEPQRYQQASPLNLALPANTLLLQGTADPIVPLAATTVAAGAAGLRLLPIGDAGHFDLIHPGSDAWPQVLAAIRAGLSPPAP